MNNLKKKKNNPSIQLTSNPDSTHKTRIIRRSGFRGENPTTQPTPFRRVSFGEIFACRIPVSFFHPCVRVGIQDDVSKSLPIFEQKSIHHNSFSIQSPRNSQKCDSQSCCQYWQQSLLLHQYRNLQLKSTNKCFMQPVLPSGRSTTLTASNQSWFSNFANCLNCWESFDLLLCRHGRIVGEPWSWCLLWWWFCCWGDLCPFDNIPRCCDVLVRAFFVVKLVYLFFSIMIC